jgi:hypothetical protein
VLRSRKNRDQPEKFAQHVAMATLADPQGARFALITYESMAS